MQLYSNLCALNADTDLSTEPANMPAN